jgi:hypothetical protein
MLIIVKAQGQRVTEHGRGLLKGHGLRAKFSAYNLPGRRGPATNLTVIYDELAR